MTREIRRGPGGAQFRAIVADDEPLARRMVASILKADPEIETVVECPDAKCVKDYIARVRPDIAFLDIEMPGMSGLEIAGALHDDGPVVVFITAFSTYATDAFDVAAIDYVTKPFSDQRFREAVERAKRRVRERRLGELATQVASLSAELRHDGTDARQADDTYLQRLTLREGDKSIIVKAAEIVWIQAEDYYVLIHSKQGRHMIRASLASLEQRLDPVRFLRVHRTAIVNLDEIRTIQDRGPLVLTLSNGAEVSVSRSRRTQVDGIIRPRLSRGR
jgi:two-component system LytT family response regulator